MDEETSFKDSQDEYLYHLIRAEYHLRRAHYLASTFGKARRSYLCQVLLRRAHDIVLGLYTQESTNRKKSR